MNIQVHASQHARAHTHTHTVAPCQILHLSRFTCHSTCLAGPNRIILQKTRRFTNHSIRWFHEAIPWNNSMTIFPDNFIKQILERHQWSNGSCASKPCCILKGVHSKQCVRRWTTLSVGIGSWICLMELSHGIVSWNYPIHGIVSWKCFMKLNHKFVLWNCVM